MALLAGMALLTAEGGLREGPQSPGPPGTVVVSNMRDHTATVLEAATGRVLATLPTGQGPHEVTISRDGRWALVSNYGTREQGGSSITVIDIARLEVTRTIDLGEYRRPHGMAFFPGDTLVAVTSEVSHAVLLLDFRSGHVIRAVPTNGRTTHMLGLSAAGDRMVTSNIADNTISSLEPLGTTEPVVIRVARQPEGIAITPDGREAWAGSNQDSVVVIVNLRTGLPADTLRGFGLPYRIGISGDGRRAVISDPVKGEIRLYDVATRRARATITVARDSLVTTAEVPGSPSPEGVAVSHDGRWAFVTLQGRNRLAIVDVERGVIVGYGQTGTWSDGVGYSPVPRH